MFYDQHLCSAVSTNRPMRKSDHHRFSLSRKFLRYCRVFFLVGQPVRFGVSEKWYAAHEKYRPFPISDTVPSCTVGWHLLPRQALRLMSYTNLILKSNPVSNTIPYPNAKTKIKPDCIPYPKPINSRRNKAFSKCRRNRHRITPRLSPFRYFW